MSVSLRKRTWSNKGRSGEAWQVDVAFARADGSLCRKRFHFTGRKPEASDWGGRAEIALRAGLPIPSQHPTEEGKEETFATFAENFLRTYAVKNKPGEQKAKETIIRRWLIPKLGDLPLEKITIREIDELQSFLLEDASLSRKTASNIFTVLRTIMGRALEYGAIRKLPKIERIKVKDPDIRAFDEAEAERLLQHMAPDGRTLLLVALRTGMRRGELRALRWIDVDLLGRKVHVRQAFARKVLGTPKGNRPRSIDLSGEAAEALRKHPRHLRWEYVFTQEDGAHLRDRDMQRLMEAARDAAGITWTAPASPAKNGRKERSGRKAGWHTCRHTFISRLVSFGVPLPTVQALAGHVNIRETLRYAHLAPSATRTAVALLDGTKSVAQTATA